MLGSTQVACMYFLLHTFVILWGPIVPIRSKPKHAHWGPGTVRISNEEAPVECPLWIPKTRESWIRWIHQQLEVFGERNNIHLWNTLYCGEETNALPLDECNAQGKEAYFGNAVTTNTAYFPNSGNEQWYTAPCLQDMASVTYDRIWCSQWFPHPLESGSRV